MLYKSFSHHCIYKTKTRGYNKHFHFFRVDEAALRHSLKMVNFINFSRRKEVSAVK